MKIGDSKGTWTNSEVETEGPAPMMRLNLLGRPKRDHWVRVVDWTYWSCTRPWRDRETVFHKCDFRNCFTWRGFSRQKKKKNWYCAFFWNPIKDWTCRSLISYGLNVLLCFFCLLTSWTLDCRWWKWLDLHDLNGPLSIFLFYYY